jgi:LmbE family N-acetylglucosaminyl deacetylase
MDIPESILVVGAHPDDCEFGAGGVAFEWARLGCQVHFLIVTDGSKGSAGCPDRPEELVALRREEQKDAAELLGVKNLHFLGFADGELEYNEVLLGKLVESLRTIRPRVVFTHTPEHLNHRKFLGQKGAGVNHRDHRVVGAATLDAVYPFARNPNSFQEQQLRAHSVEQVFLWGSRYCDTGFECEEGIRRKAQALACHRSQFDRDTDWEGLIKAWGSTEKFERVEP